MIVSEPRSRMPARTLSFRPLIMALTVITVVMPITMPRIVSDERSGFFRSVSNASRTSSPNRSADSLRAPAPVADRIGSADVRGKVLSNADIAYFDLMENSDPITYSDLRASTGSSFAAFEAG